MEERDFFDYRFDSVARSRLSTCPFFSLDLPVPARDIGTFSSKVRDQPSWVSVFPASHSLSRSRKEILAVL